ncbi:MAG: SUF system NifU family Fe-S cluster assembly protein [Bacilli bacterium]|nr:SUF system NifU family Fe-S cluster assembly protein [Bacilli bacterium]
MDEELKREIIIDNYQHPVHKGLVDDEAYIKENTNNESCIDNIDIMVKVENGVIEDIVFDGEACAISTSATSIMIKSLLNKKVEEAKKILLNYENMINEGDYDKKLLGELNVYDTIYKQPNRKMCALLPHNAIKKILEEIEKA